MGSSYLIRYKMTTTKIILASLLSLTSGHIIKTKSHNTGWAAYLADEPSEFHNLPLSWESSNPIPTYVKGSYVKNGPSQKRFGTENRWYSHYFDSWAKLNKITFTDEGEALFSGRMVETANYVKCREADKLVPTVTVGGVLPNDWNLWETAEGVKNLYDNTNVLMWRLGSAENGSYIATTDYPLVHYINPDTLAVTGVNTPPIFGGMSLTTGSHWIREIGKDTSLNYHLMLNPLNPMHPNMCLFRYGNNMDERELVGQFPIDHVNYNHMISNTANYAIIVIYPVIMKYWESKHPIETLEFLEDEPTKAFLINLHDGSVVDGFQTWDRSVIFATHHANAWEEGDEVVFDLAANDWTAMQYYLELETMLHHNETQDQVATQVMKRIRLVKSTREMIVEDWPNPTNNPMLNTMDFPMINMNYWGSKNRFAYGWVGIDYWRQSLVKKDLESTESKIWSMENNYPGEMYFIPNPDAEDEDDGTVITVVFDGEREQSYLLLLDGKTFQEINRSYLPHNIPFSFHGNWFPELLYV